MGPRRVSLFVTCLVDLLYPEVGEATVALLRDLDVEVDFPPTQTCCGQPAFNSGFESDARRVASGLLDAMELAEAVVSPSGSCTAMVRSYYPHLFHGTADERRARALAAKTFELSEFVVGELGVESLDGAWELAWCEKGQGPPTNGWRSVKVPGSAHVHQKNLAGTDTDRSVEPASDGVFPGPYDPDG